MGGGLIRKSQGGEQWERLGPIIIGPIRTYNNRKILFTLVCDFIRVKMVNTEGYLASYFSFEVNGNPGNMTPGPGVRRKVRYKERREMYRGPKLTSSRQEKKDSVENKIMKEKEKRLIVERLQDHKRRKIQFKVEDVIRKNIH